MTKAEKTIRAILGKHFNDEEVDDLLAQYLRDKCKCPKKEDTGIPPPPPVNVMGEGDTKPR